MGDLNMKKIFLTLMMLVGLLLTACDKDEIVRPPIEWSWEILTPQSVRYEGGSVGWAPKIYFSADGREGNIVITCKNYPDLSFAETSLESYDCGWATLKIDGNTVTIHFPEHISGNPEALAEITIIGRNGKSKARAVICLTRTFDGGNEADTESFPEQPDSN